MVSKSEARLSNFSYSTVSQRKSRWFVQRLWTEFMMCYAALVAVDKPLDFEAISLPVSPGQ